jgi:hypothetical protein
VIVVDWTSIDGPLELAEDYMYGRTGHDIFGMEDSARKSYRGGHKDCVISTTTRQEGETQMRRTQMGEISKNYNAYFLF